MYNCVNLLHLMASFIQEPKPKVSATCLDPNISSALFKGLIFRDCVYDH